MASLQRLVSHALIGGSRAIFTARHAEAEVRRLIAQALHPGRRAAPTSAAHAPSSEARGAPSRKRNILFITVDQQRYDALGVNGGTVARTPALDALARDGINYRRAHVQSVVCMPSRSTMLTGQHPRTHGVV